MIVNLTKNYFIKILPIPVFELLVNLEYSLPFLKEKKMKKKNRSVMGAISQRVDTLTAIPKNYPVDSRLSFVNGAY